MHIIGVAPPKPLKPLFTDFWKTQRGFKNHDCSRGANAYLNHIYLIHQFTRLDRLS